MVFGSCLFELICQLLRVYWKSTFVVEGRSLKSEQKQEVKPERLSDFSNSKQDSFLVSCLAVAKSFAVLSLDQHEKVFLLKRLRKFFHLTFFRLTFIKLVSIFIVIVIDLFIDVYSKIHKRRATFFERRVEVNSLKQAYIEGGTCKTNRDEHGGGKIGNFERTYFLNPLR